MGARRVNPNLVKMHLSYSIGELSIRLGVHKNTVRQWQRDGLSAIDDVRPLLFQGRTVRAFLTARNLSRKRPCSPGTLYCFRCREPRRPALGVAEYLPMTSTSGNLRARCETCETTMHRRVHKIAIATVMPGCSVQIAVALPRLSGSPPPSPNCDSERQAAA